MDFKKRGEKKTLTGDKSSQIGYTKTIILHSIKKNMTSCR